MRLNFAGEIFPVLTNEDFLPCTWDVQFAVIPLVYTELVGISRNVLENMQVTEVSNDGFLKCAQS